MRRAHNLNGIEQIVVNYLDCVRPCFTCRLYVSKAVDFFSQKQIFQSLRVKYVQEGICDTFTLKDYLDCISVL